MFMKYIDGKQHICFDIDELFAWQDALDEINDQTHPAWKLFDDFLWTSENKLEYSEEFIKEMEEIKKKLDNGDYSDFVEWKDWRC